MRKRKCRVCEKDYPTILEDDYTGECSDCEELSIQEQAEKQKELEDTEASKNEYYKRILL